MIKQRMKKRTLVCLSGSLMLFVFALFNLYSEKTNAILAICVLISSVYFVYLSRNSIATLLMSFFILYSNYSVVVGVYLFPQMRKDHALYWQITDTQVYGIAILMVLLFMLAMIALAPCIPYSEDNFIVSFFCAKENYSPTMFSGLTVLFFLILILGYSRVESGRGTSSAIYEYAIIILILMFHYKGTNKYLNYICVIAALLYSVNSILNGTRIEALQCIFVVIICFSKKRISFKWILTGAFAGIILLDIVGNLRGNYTSIQNMIGGVIQGLFDDKLVFDTCTFAFFPSMCMIELFKNYSFQDAFYFFKQFALSVFMGENRVADSSLIKYTLNYYLHYWGGFSVGFFYVWFSYLGGFIMSIAPSMYIRVLDKNNIKNMSPYKMCALIYFCSTVPRWYLYGPWPLFRGVLICLILFYATKKIDMILFRHNRQTGIRIK